MRYSIVSMGLSVEEIAAIVKRQGGRHIQVARAMRQVFADLDEAAAAAIDRDPGLTVKAVKSTRVSVSTPGAAVYGSYVDTMATYLWELRNLLSPPLTGEGFTIAILDSGVRKSHVSLEGKVVYEANFSSSPTLEDVYDHGTGVAYCAAGGRAVEGEEQGVAPGARLASLKVLDDEGRGTEEAVVMGLERAIELREGHDPSHDLYINVVNLSLGAPDDGDPNNPMRVAVRTSVLEHQLGVAVAAGNEGPGPGSVLCPASEPWAEAVGALTYSPFEAWQYSSRGPTREGFVKPDVMWFGVSRLVASARSDTAYEVKSGTSFASPSYAGAAALFREALQRLWGVSLEQYLPQLWEAETGLQVMDQVYRQLCAKPQGAPAGKDNTYGYGLPLGNLAARTFGGTGMGMDMSAFGGLVAPALGLGLMGLVGTGMMKAMRREKR